MEPLFLTTTTLLLWDLVRITPTSGCDGHFLPKFTDTRTINYENSTMAYIMQVLIDGSRHSSSSCPAVKKLFKLLPPGIVRDLVKSQVLSYKPREKYRQSDRENLVDMLNAHVPHGR